TLIADRDLAELRGQFERDFPRSFSWRDLESGPALWRAELLKTAGTALPQIVGHSRALAAAATDATAVSLKSGVADRGLDSQLTGVAAGGASAAHAGPGIDVLLIVVDGPGGVSTEIDEVAVGAGDLVWLPKHSRRAIRAGSAGLRYLTVHTHKTGLQITRP